MKAFTLYFILLKATVTSFAGLASLPIVRQDLVVTRHLLTDEQLNTAVAVTRTTPGPVGVYVVSVGYFVDGVAGAISGWLAMITPALLIIPVIYFSKERVDHPRIRNVIQMVVLSSAGLLWAAAFPLARSAVVNRSDVILLLAGTLVLLSRRVESLWVVLGSALVGLATATF